MIYCNNDNCNIKKAYAIFIHTTIVSVNFTGDSAIRTTKLSAQYGWDTNTTWSCYIWALFFDEVPQIVAARVEDFPSAHRTIQPKKWLILLATNRDFQPLLFVDHRTFAFENTNC